MKQIDEAMYGIRKRQNKFNEIFDQDVVFLDVNFTQLLIFAMTDKAQDVNYKCDEGLQSYWVGQTPKLGKSWKHMKALYTIHLVNGNHWVGVKVDLQICEIFVFYCNMKLCDEFNVGAFMEPLCTMMPIMLKQSGMFDELGEKLRSPWPCKRVKDLPQNKK